MNIIEVTSAHLHLMGYARRARANDPIEPDTMPDHPGPNAMRIVSATLGTETNTFSPLPTGLAAFQQYSYDPSIVADADLNPFAMPMRAMRERGRRDGWTMFEGKIAFAMPAGMTTRQAYEFLRDQMLDDIRASLPLDMVLLGLHGAMVADGYEDAEGDLLASIRALVGPDTVIGVTAKRRVQPVRSVFDCRMLNIDHTTREPMHSIVDRIKALEGQGPVLSVSIAFDAGVGAKVRMRIGGKTGVTSGDPVDVEAEIIHQRQSLLM